MMGVCEGDLRGTRDRALIAFAFASGRRRRSEVAAATMEALERHPDGSFTYVLGRSKTNQLAKRRAIDHKPVEGAAADYLHLWLAVSGIESGALWRRIEGDRVTTPLSDTAVYDIIVKRARQARVPGAVTKLWRPGIAFIDTEDEGRNTARPCLAILSLCERTRFDVTRTSDSRAVSMADGRAATHRCQNPFTAATGVMSNCPPDSRAPSAPIGYTSRRRFSKLAASPSVRRRRHAARRGQRATEGRRRT
jgi:hypothetical protein